MEGTSLNASPAPDLVEVMAELRQGRPTFLDRPLSDTTELLYTFIAGHRNEDVRISFRQRHLMFDQQLHYVGSQRKRSMLSVLDMPLPGALAATLWLDIDSHIGEVVRL